MFNWTWPHENPCDVELRLEWNDPAAEEVFTREGLFRVENDLDLIGEISMRGEWQGPLEEGGWARVGERLTLGGLTVVYENTTDVFPPPGVFNVSLRDNDGDSVDIPHESGRPVDLTILADDATDIDEAFTFSIVDLPGTAEARSSLSIHIGIDGDLPTFKDAIPEIGYWHSSSDVMISITADDGQTSGIDASMLEYEYSLDGPGAFGAWTRAGLETTPSGREMDGLATLHLPDGDDNYVRWRVRDRVGNGYATSPDYNIWVDTLNVTFFDMLPVGWQNTIQVVCGVTIDDVEGSGIIASSVQYRTSPLNLSHYGSWTDWDEGSQGDATRIVARAVLEFPEGPYGYVQWRAMDIAGNGYTTSPHYRVMVDISPPVLVSLSPPSDVKRGSDIVLVLAVFQDLLSGVDASRGFYRFSTTGAANLGDWRDAVLHGTDGNFTVHIQLECVCGRDNVIQLKIADVVGNVLVMDPHYIWVNSPPVAIITEPVVNVTYSSLVPVVLDAAGTWDLDGDGINCSWYVMGSEVPVAFGMNTSALLPPGLYTVYLIARDDDGASSKTGRDILVEEPSEPRTREDILRPWLWILLGLVMVAVVGLGYRLYVRIVKEHRDD